MIFGAGGMHHMIQCHICGCMNGSEGEFQYHMAIHAAAEGAGGMCGSGSNTGHHHLRAEEMRMQTAHQAAHTTEGQVRGRRTRGMCMSNSPQRDNGEMLQAKKRSCSGLPSSTNDFFLHRQLLSPLNVTGRSHTRLDDELSVCLADSIPAFCLTIPLPSHHGRRASRPTTAPHRQPKYASGDRLTRLDPHRRLRFVLLQGICRWKMA